jgi:hypothetical protein
MTPDERKNIRAFFDGMEDEVRRRADSLNRVIKYLPAVLAMAREKGDGCTIDDLIAAMDEVDAR